MGTKTRSQVVPYPALPQTIQGEAQRQGHEPTEIMRGVVHGRSAYLKRGYSGDPIVDPPTVSHNAHGHVRLVFLVCPVFLVSLVLLVGYPI